MTAPILPAEGPQTIARIVEILRAGGLAALPTETVYGLAADARSPRAVARIYEAKGRPSFNPLIAHVADLDAARAEGEFSQLALKLADAFWPGPLTLVVPRRADGTVCDLARAGLDTVALRVPTHPAAHDVIAAFGGPLAMPSANPSGMTSATTAQHVAEGLGERIDAILDCGPSPIGVESSVVAVTGDRPVLLRPGGLGRGDIEVVAGPLAAPGGDPDAPASPGMLARHYAPNAMLRLNADAPEPGEGFLGFGPACATADLNLSASGDMREAAANLFAFLRALDARFARIAVAPIPETSLGEAINDRLRRAAKRD